MNKMHSCRSPLQTVKEICFVYYLSHAIALSLFISCSHPLTKSHPICTVQLYLFLTHSQILVLSLSSIYLSIYLYLLFTQTYYVSFYLTYSNTLPNCTPFLPIHVHLLPISFYLSPMLPLFNSHFLYPPFTRTLTPCSFSLSQECVFLYEMMLLVTIFLFLFDCMRLICSEISIPVLIYQIKKSLPDWMVEGTHLPTQAYC